MRIGQQAPEFALPDRTGTVRTLSELRGDGRAAVFFYLTAGSPVCVAEVDRFRAAGEEFDRRGAARIGISLDPPARTQAFADVMEPGFPLLTDADGAVAAEYGVLRGRYSVAPVKRRTFLIDTDGTVLHIVIGELRAVAHVEETLAFLRTLSA
ncbi:peroxiredoxin family protein [Tsukamurella spumae]|uniref:thioredoxin-dependent peroxiredoxin n=1 Tax=Tsukamurella spumae TaxID=44753 RepID=A0A846WWY7_9ACTN|nr:redoxin domain-containing protein [Tsukamurella spumae]NKY16916.1 redoxin domain-containing protein [Tsukamurella spumae]